MEELNFLMHSHVNNTDVPAGKGSTDLNIFYD